MSGGEDLGQIRSRTEALAQVSMKIGEAMYKAQQGAGPSAAPGGDAGGAGPGTSGGGDEKVVDADFEEVDERKKRSG